jgi:hypothetical protein
VLKNYHVGFILVYFSVIGETEKTPKRLSPLGGFVQRLCMHNRQRFLVLPNRRVNFHAIKQLGFDFMNSFLGVEMAVLHFIGHLFCDIPFNFVVLNCF